MKPFVLLLLLIAGLFPAARKAGALTPYKEMLSDPLHFSGHDPFSPDLSALKHIAIGLFLPEGSDDPAALSVTRGASLAVELANAAGGYRGIPFELHRRWDDNPWAGGAREMVRMVYEDRALGVIAFLSSSGHIAEQIAARVYIPVITPVSADPTLTRSRIPWIFRLPPDFRMQARALVEKGILLRKLNRVGIITSSDNDGRMAALEFRRELEKAGVRPIFNLQPEPFAGEVMKSVAHIRLFSPDGLVLNLPPHLVPRFLEELRQAGITCPVFLPWIPGLKPADLMSAYGGTLVAVDPFMISPGTGRYDEFFKTFTNRFGSHPSFEAAYGFDAAQMIIAAVTSRGLKRSDIREALASMSLYQGVSGEINWDNGGGNLTSPLVRVISE